MKMQQRVINLLLADLRSAQMIAALCALMAGFMLVRMQFFHVENVSVYLVALTHVAPLCIWGSLFVVYAMARLATALGYSIWPLCCMASVLGMALWASVFAAGTILREAPSGLAILYAIPAAFEVWAMGQTLAFMKGARGA